MHVRLEENQTQSGLAAEPDVKLPAEPWKLSDFALLGHICLFSQPFTWTNGPSPSTKGVAITAISAPYPEPNIGAQQPLEFRDHIPLTCAERPQFLGHIANRPPWRLDITRIVDFANRVLLGSSISHGRIGCLSTSASTPYLGLLREPQDLPFSTPMHAAPPGATDIRQDGFMHE